MKNTSLVKYLIATLVVIFLYGCASIKNVIFPTSKTKTVSTKFASKENFSQNDLIYFIMTDRFCNGNKQNDINVNLNDPKAYHGGDIEGIIQKLDYIKSLGATAIWITPIVENTANGYHGYWAEDYYKVDPHLGTMSDMKNLVKEAHKRNIKVLLDYVANHVGSDSTWLTDGKHKGWFHPHKDIVNFDDPKQCENGWLSGLPDLNQDSKAVSDYLINNALWWIKNTNIDGMRLDTVRHVPQSFWKKFTSSIKKSYPNFYFLGEVYSGDVFYAEQYHECGIDGVTNYSLFYGMREAFSNNGSTSKLLTSLQDEAKFKTPYLNGIFIDNHDNKRFMTLAEETSDKNTAEKYLHEAICFELTYPAIPVIYYGTEIGMEGGDDPDNRRDMDWNKTSSSKDLEFYKKLIQIRESEKSLKSADFSLLSSDTNFISYKRGSSDGIIIAMNTSKNSTSKSVSADSNVKSYTDLLTNKVFSVQDSRINMSLEPVSFVILKPNYN